MELTKCGGTDQNRERTLMSPWKFELSKFEGVNMCIIESGQRRLAHAQANEQRLICMLAEFRGERTNAD